MLPPFITNCGHPISGKTGVQKILAEEPVQLELDLATPEPPIDWVQSFPAGARGHDSAWDLGTMVISLSTIATVLGAVVAALL